ncbi:MAG: glycosyltransferase family 4 protein [Chloroflexi bacterium]|nr:glycosyltransferase family 4 protein [Chloroflexota bacterium]
MSTHQFHMWKAFREMSRCEFTLVLESQKEIQTKEVSLGELQELGKIIFPAGFRWIAGLAIMKQNPDAIHVFTGFRNVWYFFPLICYALFHNIKVAVMNEPYSIHPVGYFQEEASWQTRLKVGTRPYLYRGMARLLTYAEQQVPPCILPLSLIAMEQFKQGGFDSKTMYPFGYFVPGQPVNHMRLHQKTHQLRLIFVGSLLLRKGLDLAVQSIEDLNRAGFDITLDVYGHGSPEKFFSLPSTCVFYKGALLPKNVQAVMSHYDMLILPSRHDGWGVVVNEALLQGVPVIVSDRVGAKCLIEKSGAGVVFSLEDGGDLTIKLSALFQKPELITKMRQMALLVGSAISPEEGAKYLLNVFQHHFFSEGQRPSALWATGRINEQ